MKTEQMNQITFGLEICSLSVRQMDDLRYYYNSIVEESRCQGQNQKGTSL